MRSGAAMVFVTVRHAARIVPEKDSEPMNDLVKLRDALAGFVSQCNLLLDVTGDERPPERVVLANLAEVFPGWWAAYNATASAIAAADIPSPARVMHVLNRLKRPIFYTGSSTEFPLHETQLESLRSDVAAGFSPSLVSALGLFIQDLNDTIDSGGQDVDAVRRAGDRLDAVARKTDAQVKHVTQVIEACNVTKPFPPPITKTSRRLKPEDYKARMEAFLGVNPKATQNDFAQHLNGMNPKHLNRHIREKHPELGDHWDNLSRVARRPNKRGSY
jgi:hypothetical protein